MPINKIKAGSIDTGSITSDKIAADAVTSAKIANDTIANADISSSAAIAYSKLNLATSIANADISSSAAIAYSKLNLGTSIVNADVSSNAGITLNKISGNTGFKNVIINGGFILNQRGYTSGTALASGSYGHDRWKGGASGGTYTFTQGSTGVNTTLTITAGSIIQVIEGTNLPVGGTYVLSWTGTAQGKIGSGSFGSSGVTGTITAGTNTNIEFSTGTCGNVQLEFGSVATSFDYRPFTTELALCQRYFETSFNPGVAPANGIYTQTFLGHIAYGDNWALVVPFVTFKVLKRVTPTIITYGQSSTGGWQNYNPSGGWLSWVTTSVNDAGQGAQGPTATGFSIYTHNDSSSGLPVGYARAMRGDWTASAEL
jgi:hypothetical protein